MTDTRPTIPTIPVLLLTGFLGSGKTTLVNHILTNREGIRFAVIVNDIGEVNIDASLIEQGGVVDSADDSLVALQNGCICCSLKMDLVKQIEDIIAMRRFDYLVIEASGICDPGSIAQTICSIPFMGAQYATRGIPRLDCIVTVVDALRLRSEFDSGHALTHDTPATPDADTDIENLIVEQIEFCNIVLLNKCSEVTPQELQEIRDVVRALQPGAEIIDTDYARVDINRIIDTHLFHFDTVATSAGWVRELERPVTPAQEAAALRINGATQAKRAAIAGITKMASPASPAPATDDHHHDHHHGHDCGCSQCAHDHGHHHHHVHVDTFLYYRRAPMDLDKFDRFLATQWPRNVIRTKGVIYFQQNPDMSYLFQQAGVQKKLTEAGMWFATAPDDDRQMLLRDNPDMMRDWDPHYGDRMVKLVFIGRNLDPDAIADSLDACLGQF